MCVELLNKHLHTYTYVYVHVHTHVCPCMQVTKAAKLDSYTTSHCQQRGGLFTESWRHVTTALSERAPYPQRRIWVSPAFLGLFFPLNTLDTIIWQSPLENEANTKEMRKYIIEVPGYSFAQSHIIPDFSNTFLPPFFFLFA